MYEDLKATLREYADWARSNGWGTVESTLNALKSLYQCILDNRAGERKTWNEIPLELMYMRW